MKKIPTPEKQKNHGNTAIFQVMLEYVLQFRLAFNIGALYMVPAKYADGFDIGGFGGATRFAFNW